MFKSVVLHFVPHKLKKKHATSDWKWPIHTLEQQHRDPEHRNEKLVGIKLDKKKQTSNLQEVQYNYGNPSWQQAPTNVTVTAVDPRHCSVTTS